MRKALYLGVAAGLLVGMPVQAGMAPLPRALAVDQFTCGELLALPEPDLDRGVVYFLGIIDGQRRNMVFDVQMKAELMDRVLEHCRANPATTVLDAFAKVSP